MRSKSASTASVQIDRFATFRQKLTDAAFDVLVPDITQFTSVSYITDVVRLLPVSRHLQDIVYRRLLSYLGEMQTKSLIVHKRELQAGLPHSECFWCKEYGRSTGSGMPEEPVMLTIVN